MSSNSDWAGNFKDRLEDAGWRVELSGTSHYKVFDGLGATAKMIMTFSGTPGDKRAMMNALSQAKRAGLLELENKVKLKREKERLQRIEDDRVANEAKLAGIALKFNSQDDEVDGDALSSPDFGLGYVNGVAVVAVAPAMVMTPVMKKPAALTDGSEIMLSNDTVLYRCEKPAATGTKPDLEGICHRTFESAVSLRVHMIAHKPNAAKHLAQSLEDVEPVTTKPKTSLKTSLNGVPATAKLAKRLNDAFDSVTLLMKGMDEVRVELTEIKSDLTKLQVADDDTLQKAAKFDTLSGSFKALLS